MGVNWLWDFAAWCIGHNFAVAGSISRALRQGYRRGWNAAVAEYERLEAEAVANEFDGKPTVVALRRV